MFLGTFIFFDIYPSTRIDKNWKMFELFGVLNYYNEFVCRDVGFDILIKFIAVNSFQDCYFK
jgi:hypothetical protein